MLLRGHWLIAKEDDLVFVQGLADVIDDGLGEIGREINTADLGANGCTKALDVKVVPSQLGKTSSLVGEVQDRTNPFASKGLAMTWRTVATRFFIITSRFRRANFCAQPTPRNSVLLGGDLHQNYVCAVHADPEAAPERRNPVVASEFCSTSITSRSGTTQAKVDAIVDHNPQVLYARCEERGYGLADITPERWTSELRAVANPMRADSRIYTLARFTVEDRRPGPVAS